MGVFDEAKGKLKDKAGEVTGDRNLEAEGEAQNARGEADREASQERVKAQGHETKADELKRASEQAKRSDS